MTIIRGQQLRHRPDCPEASPGHLSRIATPAPAIAAHRGDDATRRPGTRQQARQRCQIVITGPSTRSFVTEDAIEEISNLEDRDPNPWLGDRVGRIKWGVEKFQYGEISVWREHVMSIICFGGYSPASPLSRASSCSASSGVIWLGSRERSRSESASIGAERGGPAAPPAVVGGAGSNRVG